MTKGRCFGKSSYLEIIMKKALLAAGLAAVLGLLGFSQSSPSQKIEDQVVSTLLSLPLYGVFDNLAYELEGTNVVLSGQVLMPITKEEAGKRVARIQGIGKLTNSIEILPLSGIDDAIRLRAYRMLFGTANLYRYSLGANPLIHIIVKGGHITLEGIVSSEDDAKLALLSIRGIQDSLSQKSSLKVSK